ncbi:rRNA adenine N-6-methyltransferase family protein, partial [Enterobacter roggenkampii]
VVALEKDRDLLPLLAETFANEVAAYKLSIVEGDALTFDPSIYFGTASQLQTTGYKLPAAPYKLIANIPYYITGAI